MSPEFGSFFPQQSNILVGFVRTVLFYCTYHKIGMEKAARMPICSILTATLYNYTITNKVASTSNTIIQLVLKKSLDIDCILPHKFVLVFITIQDYWVYLSEQSQFIVNLTGLVWRRQQECHSIYHCHSGV